MVYLEGLSAGKISEVNIATGIPRVYEYNTDLKLLHVYYLP